MRSTTAPDVSSSRSHGHMSFWPYERVTSATSSSRVIAFRSPNTMANPPNTGANACWSRSLSAGTQLPYTAKKEIGGMEGSEWIFVWKCKMRAGSKTEQTGGPWAVRSWCINRAMPFFPWGSTEDIRWYWPRLTTVTSHSNSWRGAPVGLNSPSEIIFGSVGNCFWMASRECPKRSFVMEGPPRL